jgi:hypothetical protein
VGIFARIAQRALGLQPVLRSTLDRWHIARADDTTDSPPSAFEHSGFVEPAMPETHPMRALVDPPESHRAETRRKPAAVEAVMSEPAHPREPLLRTDAPLPPHARRRETAPPPRRERVAPRFRSEPPVIREAAEPRAARLLPPQAPSPVDRRPTEESNGTSRRPARDEPAPVYVHIDRIDVRTAEPRAPKAPAKPRATLRKPSLEAHLLARERGPG